MESRCRSREDLRHELSWQHSSIDDCTNRDEVRLNVRVMHKVRQLVAILIQMLLHLSVFASRSIDRVDSAFDWYPIDLACITDGEAGNHGLRNLSVILLLSLLKLGLLGSETFRSQPGLCSLEELGVFFGDLFSKRRRWSTDDNNRRTVDEQSNKTSCQQSKPTCSRLHTYRVINPDHCSERHPRSVSYH
jgi:hypothetical protein